MKPPSSRLKASAVGVHFDGVTALDSVSIEIETGEIVGLIGPNGAGKTTLVNVLTGFQRPDSGQVDLDGRSNAGLRPNEIARLGIARTFQAARLFGNLSVLDNLRVSAFGTQCASEDVETRCTGILRFLGISSLANKPAASLPYGYSRRVGLGRALAMMPRFILLDEPAAGMSEPECEDLIEIIRAIPARFSAGASVADRAQYLARHGSAGSHPCS